VESLRTEDLRIYLELGYPYPLTFFKELTPLLIRAVDNEPEIAKVSTELNHLEEQICNTPDEVRIHDYQPEYQVFLNMCRRRNELKKFLPSLRRIEFSRIRRDSEEQQKILAAEVSTRRLLGI
jgi:hypothetical protein